MAKMLWEDDEEENQYEEGAALSNEQVIALYVEHKRMVRGVSERCEEDYETKLSTVNSICRDELGIADWHWQMMRVKVMDRVVKWMRAAPKLYRYGDRKGTPVLDASGRKQRRYSDYSILRYVVVEKGFYDWAREQKYVGKDLLEAYKNPSVNNETGVGGGFEATREELEGLLRSINEYYESPLAERGMRGKRGGRERTFHRLRNQAMVLFLSATEMRPRSACALKRYQIVQREDGTGYLVLAKSQSKNRKEQRVEIDAVTMQAIAAYLAVRDKIKFPSGDQGWLFCMEGENKHGGQQIHSGRWTRVFARLVEFGQSRGYITQGRDLTPYSLKRMAFTQNLEHSVEATLMQAGHTSGLGIATSYARNKSRAEIERMALVQAEAQRRIALDKAGVNAGLENVRLK